MCNVLKYNKIFILFRIENIKYIILEHFFFVSVQSLYRQAIYKSLKVNIAVIFIHENNIFYKEQHVNEVSSGVVHTVGGFWEGNYLKIISFVLNSVP